MKPIKLITAILLAAILVAGCSSGSAAKRDPSSELQAELQQLRQENAQLKREGIDNTKEILSLKTINAELNDRIQRLSTASAKDEGPQEHVFKALTWYIYDGFSNGRLDLAMAEPSLKFGFTAKGYPEYEEHVPADQLDLSLVRRWIQEHPIGQAESLSLGKGQPGWWIVGITYADNFEVVVLYHGYKLSGFLISDHHLDRT